MKVTIENTREKRGSIRPYLVDVPVKINIWVRPRCQKLQFEVLKKARPSILFIQSDGGRNKEEWDLINQNRKYIEDNIDWECTIYKIYAEKNHGLYSMYFITDEYIWNNVDRCIYLEDDHVPAVSFFAFCAEMLEKYKDDLRIGYICGMNHLGEYNKPQSDYFFSRVGSIWGIAYWKRTIETFNVDYKEDSYVLDEVLKIAQKNKFFCDAMKTYARQERHNGHVAGPEFYLELNIYANNQLAIIPSKNMISCHGCEEGSTHAANSIKKMAKGDAQLFYMPTYEMSDNIKHPEYVFPDLDYEKKLRRVTASNHPLVSKYRRIVGICKRLYYGDGKVVLRKLIKKIKNHGLRENEN